MISHLVSTDYIFDVLSLSLLYCWPWYCLSSWRLMTLWYLIIAHSDFIFDGFWLQHWYIITAYLVYCDFPFGIYWLHLWYLLISISIYWLHLCMSLLYLWSLYFLSSLIDGWWHFCIIDNNCVIFWLSSPVWYHFAKFSDFEIAKYPNSTISEIDNERDSYLFRTITGNYICEIVLKRFDCKLYENVKYQLHT